MLTVGIIMPRYVIYTRVSTKSRAGPDLTERRKSAILRFPRSRVSWRLWMKTSSRLVLD
jgi:hypothetical protein